MAGVVLEQVSRVYPGGVTAVHRLDLEVNDHELLVLVGPSGCGKSTTLRMIAGLERVSSGQVRLGGRVVNDVVPRDRNIAMVFQNEALYPHWTVYENLAFGWRMRGRLGGGWRWARHGSSGHSADGGAPLDRRVRDVAAVLGLAPLLQRRPWQLSGGERQRVALGRALVREPDVLLLDEPLANLDAQWRVELRRELKRLHTQRRTTTIYVTHDQVEALCVGDRVGVLRDGVLEQLGTPLEVYEGPKNRFVAGFIGSPPMSFADGVVSSAAWESSGVTFSLPDEVARKIDQFKGKTLTCGLRSEDVRIGELNSQQATSDGAGLRGRVTLVEPLGEATVVYVESGADGALALAGRATPRAKVKTGDQVVIQADMRRAHWFDPATGNNVIKT